MFRLLIFDFILNFSQEDRDALDGFKFSYFSLFWEANDGEVTGFAKIERYIMTAYILIIDNHKMLTIAILHH